MHFGTGTTPAHARVAGLFADARAVVIGLPPGFGINEELRKTHRIRLATAFAHLSGWKHLESSIRGGSAEVRMLTSLAFFQTEPKLLREWRRLSADSRIDPRLRPNGGPLFHPKVLIATDKDDLAGFAIVGSGNLSDGGLRANIECGLFTDDPRRLSALITWFDGLFYKAQFLKDEAIEIYESRYKRAHKFDRDVRSEQRELEKELATIQWRWEEAAKQAKHYFKTDAYKKGWHGRSAAASKICRVLHSPAFDFTAQNWADFYDIHELGRLNPIYRDRVFKKESRLRAGLRRLIDPGIATKQRLDAILLRKGEFHIEGLGLNTISKILASHFPKQWPVYNAPVEKTLRFFGYRKLRGSSIAEAYIGFAGEMDKLMKNCGAPDVFALDAFMRWYYVKHLKKKEKKGRK